MNLGLQGEPRQSDDFTTTLIADGGREVPIEAADFIVVNTCTVTGEAEKKTRKAVRGRCCANDFARVVVTRLRRRYRSHYLYRDGSSRRSGAERRYGRRAWFPGEHRRPPWPPFVRVRNFHARWREGARYGCNNACTYCIVHVARGRAIATLEEIIAEVRELARARACGEIVLTGINLGSYREGDMRLADCCGAL